MDSFKWRARLLAAVLALLAHVFYLGEAPASEPLLRSGDRVVFLGATFVERMQSTGYLETQLTAFAAGKPMVFRNLGWSGDNVRGHSRAVFGKPDEGFNRLLKDFKQTRPTVAVVCYGANEANGGASRLQQFTADYNRLLDSLSAAAPGLRLILVAPPQRENVGPPFPDQKSYNQTLALFTKAIGAIAATRKAAFIDFRMPVKQSHAKSSSASLDRLTSNGVHFTTYGYWRAAPAFAKALGAPSQRWDVSIDAKTGNAEAAGAKVSNIKGGAVVQFTAFDASLPQHAPPAHAPRGAEMMMHQARLRVENLPAGKYELSVDGKPLVIATAQHWGEGLHFVRSYAHPQLNKLAAEIAAKNELFFHRHRPQNETYLFLFRKHEQGNNAVEIPQFDPLIEKREAKIARLAQPASHQFVIKRISE